MTFPALLSTSAAALSLLLSLWLFFSNATTQNLQGELQKRQTEFQTQQQQFQLQQQQLQSQQQLINTANQLSQQVGPAVIADLKTLAAENKNDKIKNLLTKYGVTMEEPAASGTKGAATPGAKPVATPAAKP